MQNNSAQYPEKQSNAPATAENSEKTAPKNDQEASLSTEEKLPKATKMDEVPEHVDHAEHHLPKEAHRFMRIGLLMLLILFGGFTFWAATMPLDAGVPAPGTVIVKGKPKVVSHLYGGTVKAIHVQDLQPVKQGDILIELDDTQARAEYDSLLKQYVAALAEQARLEAEQKGLDHIDFPEALKQYGTKGEADLQMAHQQQLFASRRAAMQAKLNVYRQTEQSAKADADSKREQLKLVEEQLKGMKSLADEGYVARDKYLELQRRALELRNAIARAEDQAHDAHLRAQNEVEQARKEVATQLAETGQKVAVLREKLLAAKDKLDAMVIRAPVSGRINALNVHTVGSAIRPGEPLMEIIPEGAPLVIEVHVPSNMIDRVKPHQKADVQLQNYTKDAPVAIEGEVVSVSPDLIKTKDTQTPPYYIAYVVLTDKGRKELGEDKPLMPGMPASVVIKTGERTLLEYIVHPLLRRIHMALTEE
jgi:protease secretion system membrane fusion protein